MEDLDIAGSAFGLLAACRGGVAPGQASAFPFCLQPTRRGQPARLPDSQFRITVPAHPPVQPHSPTSASVGSTSGEQTSRFYPHPSSACPLSQ